MPGQMYKLFLAGRIRVITTMIEGKVLHNSPMMDLDYKNTDALVNKWMATYLPPLGYQFTPLVLHL